MADSYLCMSMMWWLIAWIREYSIGVVRLAIRSARVTSHLRFHFMPDSITNVTIQPLSQERNDTTRLDRSGKGREMRNGILFFRNGNYTSNQEETIIETECCSAVANCLSFCFALSSILAHSRISIREREMGCKLVPAVSE